VNSLPPAIRPAPNLEHGCLGSPLPASARAAPRRGGCEVSPTLLRPFAQPDPGSARGDRGRFQPPI